MDIKKIKSEIDECVQICNDEVIKNNKDEPEFAKKYYGATRKLMSLAGHPFTPVFMRTKALFSLFEIDEELATESLIKIRDSLDFCEGELLQNTINVLRKVVFQPQFNSDQRYLTALSCYNSDLVDCYNEFFSLLLKDITVMNTYRVESAKFLFYSEIPEYVEEAGSYLKDVVKDHSLTSKYRYETIACFITDTGMAARYNVDRLPVIYNEEFVFPLQMTFFFDQKNDVRSRLLSGQHLLQMDSHEEVHDDVQKAILDIALDKTAGSKDPDTLEAIEDISDEEERTKKISEIVHNVRADAVDILIRLGKTEELKIRAAEILAELGDEDNRSALDQTFYSNKQNIHDSKIQQSANKYIEQLVLHDNGSKAMSFEDTHNQVTQLINNLELSYAQRIHAFKSLNRISIDSARFTKYKLTTSLVFCHIWKKILNSENSDDLKRRLVEELIDMSDTCSSGHCIRLVNALSSIEDDAIMINIDDQLKSNINARIHAKIRKLDEGDKKDNIVMGMIPDSEPEEREAYLAFIDMNEEALRQELFDEFVGDGYISKKNFKKLFEAQILKLKGEEKTEK